VFCGRKLDLVSTLKVKRKKSYYITRLMEFMFHKIRKNVWKFANYFVVKSLKKKSHFYTLLVLAMLYLHRFGLYNNQNIH